jgi:hypothetical protein
MHADRGHCIAPRPDDGADEIPQAFQLSSAAQGATVDGHHAHLVNQGRHLRLGILKIRGYED